MNKEGQFFLVAAIVIVGFVIGLATAVNTVQTSQPNEAFYDLADEVGFETRRVLDYGVYNAQPVDSVMRGFLENYSNYLSQESALFVYGNSSGLQALFFNETMPGTIGIDTGTVPGIITIQYTTGEQADVTYDEINEIVHVAVNDLTYDFPLRKGDNLYFVLITEEQGETYVAQGQ